MPALFLSSLPPRCSCFLRPSAHLWDAAIGSERSLYGSRQAAHCNLILYVALIIFFTYFWTATQFRPDQIASDMKKNGAFIPGIRQGKPTQDYLEHAMNSITFIGAVFLALSRSSRISSAGSWVYLKRLATSSAEQPC